MLVTSLVSLIALNLAARQQFDLRRTSNILDYDQCLLYSLGMEAWAGQILIRDAKQSAVDHLAEIWAMRIPALPVDGGELIGELVDQQGLYNINNLLNGAMIDPVELQRFQRLLTFLQLPIELTNAIADWIDPDQELRFPDGAEDQEYLLMQPPYRAANASLRSVSELRLIKGITPEIYRRIAPFVTALPERTPVNVNTAPPLVILVLAPDLQLRDAEALIEGRGSEGYRDLQRFSSQAPLAGRNTELTQGAGISVASRWFLAHGRANIGRLSVEFYSLLLRNSGRVTTVRRSQQAW